MAQVIFWLAFVMAVVGGLGVVLARQPIRSVLSLVLVMLALSILFLLLSAQFIFAVQIIVYAGAVMVLFVFVIALLGPGRELPTRRLRFQPWLAIVFGGLLGGLVIAALVQGIQYRQTGQSQVSAFFGSVESIGIGLFTTYLYPFELTSLLLLVAAIGAIYLSRRDLALDDPEEYRNLDEARGRLDE